MGRKKNKPHERRTNDGVKQSNDHDNACEDMGKESYQVQATEKTQTFTLDGCMMDDFAVGMLRYARLTRHSP